MERQIVKSVWIGKEFISIGDTRLRDNQMDFRQLGGIPFLSRFTPILANAQELQYQERVLWNPGRGATKQRVRIFMSDLRMDKYYAISNPQDIHAMASLRKENEALRSEVERLTQLMFSMTNEDKLHKRVKKQIDMYNTIKGNNAYGNSYGIYSPGFGQMGTPPPEGGGDS